MDAYSQKLADYLMRYRENHAHEFGQTESGCLALRQQLAQIRADWLEAFVPVALQAQVWQMAKALLGAIA